MFNGVVLQDVLQNTSFFDHDRLDDEEGEIHEGGEEFEECSLAIATYCAMNRPGFSRHSRAG